MSKSNYQELFIIASKPFLDRHDVRKLFSCSVGTSASMRKEFVEYYNDSFPERNPIKPKTVPTKQFLEYFSYDVESLEKMAMFEKEGLLDDK